MLGFLLWILVDISDYYDRNNGSLLLHDERTWGAMMCSGSHGEKASDRPQDILNRKYDEEKKKDSARRTQQSPEKKSQGGGLK